MKLIKEPVDVDFIIESKPWSESEVNELRLIMRKTKADATKKIKKKTKENKLSAAHSQNVSVNTARQLL